MQGHWQHSPTTQPPYTLASQLAATGRGRCPSRARAPWQYRWVPPQTTDEDVPALLRDLCGAMPQNTQVALVGDSLAIQLLYSWRSRQFERQFGAAPSVGHRHHHSTHCHNSSTQLRFVWAPNVWSKQARFASSSNLGHEACEGQMNKGLYAHAFLPRASELENIERHEAMVGADVIVWSSTFAWLSKAITQLTTCYSSAARRQRTVENRSTHGSSTFGSDFPWRGFEVTERSEHALRSLARRDVLRFWREQISLVASSLRHHHPEATVYFMTASPAAELWTRNRLQERAMKPTRPGAPQPAAQPELWRDPTGELVWDDGSKKWVFMTTRPSPPSQPPNQLSAEPDGVYAVDQPLRDCAAVSQAMEPFGGKVEYNHGIPLHAHRSISSQLARAARSPLAPHHLSPLHTRVELRDRVCV